MMESLEYEANSSATKIATISDLPEDLKLEVLKFCNARTLCAVGMLSKEWNRLSKDPHLWKAIYERNFQKKGRRFNRTPVFDIPMAEWHGKCKEVLTLLNSSPLTRCNRFEAFSSSCIILHTTNLEFCTLAFHLLSCDKQLLSYYVVVPDTEEQVEVAQIFTDLFQRHGVSEHLSRVKFVSEKPIEALASSRCAVVILPSLMKTVFLGDTFGGVSSFLILGATPSSLAPDDVSAELFENVGYSGMFYIFSSYGKVVNPVSSLAYKYYSANAGLVHEVFEDFVVRYREMTFHKDKDAFLTLRVSACLFASPCFLDDMEANFQ